MSYLAVRARNAAWYVNPWLAFAEGYVRFEQGRAPELVLWLDRKDFPRPADVLRASFGAEHGMEIAGETRHDDRPSPDDPDGPLRPAAVTPLLVRRRIPTPTHSDGHVRYESDVGGYSVDLPSHWRDPYELDIGESYDG